MLEKAINVLLKKHLFIIGKSEIDRSKFISQIIERTDFETFRFPKGMKSIDKYVDFVRLKKMYDPWYTKKGKFGGDQILDFHRDWISENHSLVILEEFQDMEERWQLDLLKSYLEEVAFREKGQKVIHLIITREGENNLLDKLKEEIQIPENEKRTKEQIISGSFEVIEIK